MDFLDVRLCGPGAATAPLTSFYLDELSFARAAPAEDDLFAVQIGRTRLSFSAAAIGSAPFYHFALLVPGDRFDAAKRWLEQRVDLLPDPETGAVVFDFDNWDARACYFLDPADNIVEFIAHRGIGEAGTRASFHAREMVGFSELGIVSGDKLRTTTLLNERAGLDVWDGDVSNPTRLVFIGERARTLIVAPPARGWLPTARPAELHPIDVLLEAPRAAEFVVPGTEQRVRARPPRGGSDERC